MAYSSTTKSDVSKSNATKSKYLNIAIIILAIGIVFALFFVLKNVVFTGSKLVFTLNGDEHITINLNEEYQDMGVTIKKGNDDLSSKVVITNNVDASNVGNYTITYSYEGMTLTRYVEVKKLNYFSLLGDSNVYLLLNGKYTDPKAELYKDGVDRSNEITVDGEFDSTKIGNYQISYSSSLEDDSLYRNIYVSDFDEYFKTNYDIDKKFLSIDIDSDKITKYTLPDGTEKNESITYSITQNGKYTFVIYDKYNNKLEKEVNINGGTSSLINATCTATISMGKTLIKVTSDSAISKYVYNGVEGDQNIYQFDREINENKVLLYDSNNDSIEITCNTKKESGNMEIHFIASGYYDDAILIRTSKATIWIDGGRGKVAVMKYLNELKITDIDYVIGSHTEYDHIDAQGEIIKNLNVKHALYPNSITSCGCSCTYDDVHSVTEALRNKNMTPEVQQIPSKLQIGDMMLYFIAPYSIGCNKNNNSFIFILQYGNTKFMFTGDADSDFNNLSKLEENAKSLGLSGYEANVFKYPHHGNGLLSNKFYDIAKIQSVIVPNYLASQHPNQTVLNTLNSKGIKVYRQSDSKTGNILIKSDGNNITFTMDIEAKDYVR